VLIFKRSGRIFCGAPLARPAKNRAIRSNFCPCGAKIPLLSLALLTNGIHAICQLQVFAKQKPGNLYSRLPCRPLRKTPGIAAAVPFVSFRFLQSKNLGIYTAGLHAGRLLQMRQRGSANERPYVGPMRPGFSQGSARAGQIKADSI
jgi:hypothetical protein